VVKIEMKIRITPEEFMKMTARYLPFEIVSAGEIVENPLPKAPPAVIALANKFKAKHAAKREKLVGREMRKSSIRLDKGMNGIVLKILADGKEHKTGELIKALIAADYQPSSINSQMAKLSEHGAVVRVSIGRWRIANAQDTEETD
jgi:hypothetical protein